MVESYPNRTCAAMRILIPKEYKGERMPQPAALHHGYLCMCEWLQFYYDQLYHADTHSGKQWLWMQTNLFE